MDNSVVEIKEIMTETSKNKRNQMMQVIQDISAVYRISEEDQEKLLTAIGNCMEQMLSDCYAAAYKAGQNGTL